MTQSDPFVLPDPTIATLPIDRPVVAKPRRARRSIAGYGGAVAVGVAVLAVLTAQRHDAANAGILPGANTRSPANFVTPQPLPEGLAKGGGGAPIAAPQFATDNQISGDSANGVIPMTAEIPMTTTSFTPGTNAAPTIVAGSGVSRLGAPAMIIDLSDGGKGGVVRALDVAPGMLPLANPALSASAKPGEGGGSTTGDAGESAQFLQRAAAPSERATASRIGALNSVVAEGSTISATLETAIDSDLPGLARAVIARNVMSFDGSRVLIPRGSRVIGQYKSGVALGGSRVFVIWTRLIRPDGASIQLLSPGSDDLGRGGLAGKVDRHFFQRFGGSLLTSVLNGAVSLGTAVLGKGTPVFINTAADATAAATSATQSREILPTVRTAQGVSIKIFVARDLDFSSVEDRP